MNENKTYIKLNEIKKKLQPLYKEKSAIEKYMSRRHEPSRVENAPLLIIKRKKKI